MKRSDMESDLHAAGLSPAGVEKVLKGMEARGQEWEAERVALPRRLVLHVPSANTGRLPGVALAYINGVYDAHTTLKVAELLRRYPPEPSEDARCLAAARECVAAYNRDHERKSVSLHCPNCRRDIPVGVFSAHLEWCLRYKYIHEPADEVTQVVQPAHEQDLPPVGPVEPDYKARSEELAGALRRLAREAGVPDDGPSEIVGAVLEEMRHLRNVAAFPLSEENVRLRNRIERATAHMRRVWPGVDRDGAYAHLLGVKPVYDLLASGVSSPSPPTVLPTEPTYPCVKCGRLRTKAEGGTIFTVCDGCWEQSS